MFSMGLRGFIPAGAGNTFLFLKTVSPSAVHPRGCGEHLFSLAVMAVILRFIPAGAGNTWPYSLVERVLAVHPRGCGEHPWNSTVARLAVGSSPRVRGTRVKASREESEKRFIPAGAGNTRNHTASHSPAPVHPRGCGEHRLSLMPRAVHPRGCGEHRIEGGPAMYDDGSSPRVRGTRA